MFVNYDITFSVPQPPLDDGAADYIVAEMSTSTNPESTNNIWKTLTDKTKSFIRIKEG